LLLLLLPLLLLLFCVDAVSTPSVFV